VILRTIIYLLLILPQLNYVLKYSGGLNSGRRCNHNFCYSCNGETTIEDTSHAVSKITDFKPHPIKQNPLKSGVLGRFNIIYQRAIS